MGYKTDFALTVDPNDEPMEEIEKALDEIGVFEQIYEGSADAYDAKWYDWQEEMLRVSRMFPTAFFTLHGLGEEHDDIWVCYFLGGMCHGGHAQIILPEFDPTKLSTQVETS